MEVFDVLKEGGAKESRVGCWVWGEACGHFSFTNGVVLDVCGPFVEKMEDLRVGVQGIARRGGMLDGAWFPAS